MHTSTTNITEICNKIYHGRRHTHFMKDHALIGKFLGIWPSESDLTKWIKHWWNPKGDYEMQLSSKGLFKIIFYSMEDKDRVF
jgi:hypothetical protein